MIGPARATLAALARIGAAAAVAAPTTTWAASLLAADQGLGHLAAAVPMLAGGKASWRLLPDGQVLAEACATPVDGGFVAMTVDPPSRRELALCADRLGQAPITALVGREAAYLVTREFTWPPLRSRDLYLALAAAVPGTDGAFTANPARRWRDLGDGLPDAEIRVLLPAPARLPGPLFARAVLEVGCMAAPEVRAIFAPDERARRCGTVRSDGPVELAAAGLDPLDWLAAQPAYALAVVGQETIARLGDDASVLSLDGVMPTYSAVAGGSYPASWPVHLSWLARRPDATALDRALALAAEASIGPAGALAAAGLTPMAPADRVALRARLFAAGAS